MRSHQAEFQKSPMNEEDDLDAELALFESQIQRVKAATKPQEEPSEAAPKPVSKAVPPTQQQPQPTHNVPTQQQAQTGRWFWDGATWRWRTSTPVTTTRSNTLPTAPTPAIPKKRPSTKRTAAGEVWHDPTLAEWPTDDHRIFVGDLAPDATEKQLSDAFGVYPSFAMARVVRDKRSGACRGYGFVSFSDGRDMVRALREMNGKYVAGRPVKLKRSSWHKRSLQGQKWKELKAFRKIAKK